VPGEVVIRHTTTTVFYCLVPVVINDRALSLCWFRPALAGVAGFKVGVLILKNNTHNNNIPLTQQNNPRKPHKLIKKKCLPRPGRHLMMGLPINCYLIAAGAEQLSKDDIHCDLSLHSQYTLPRDQQIEKDKRPLFLCFEESLYRCWSA